LCYLTKLLVFYWPQFSLLQGDVMLRCCVNCWQHWVRMMLTMKMMMTTMMMMPLTMWVLN